MSAPASRPARVALICHRATRTGPITVEWTCWDSTGKHDRPRPKLDTPAVRPGLCEACPALHPCREYLQGLPGRTASARRRRRPGDHVTGRRPTPTSEADR